jgi:hypothetical protein
MPPNEGAPVPRRMRAFAHVNSQAHERIEPIARRLLCGEVRKRRSRWVCNAQGGYTERAGSRSVWVKGDSPRFPVEGISQRVEEISSVTGFVAVFPRADRAQVASDLGTAVVGHWKSGARTGSARLVRITPTVYTSPAPLVTRSRGESPPSQVLGAEGRRFWRAQSRLTDGEHRGGLVPPRGSKPIQRTWG